MPDIDIICTQCKNPFFFSEADQAFFKSKNFSEPKRCWSCRQKRKNARVKSIEAKFNAQLIEETDYTKTWEKG